MRSIVSKIVIFAVGAVVGSAVTWKVMDEKCKKRTEEAVDAVKQSCERVYGNMKKLNEVVVQKEKERVEKEKNNYGSILSSEGYSKDDDKNKRKEDGKVRKFLPPYIIGPDEFTATGYDAAYLTLYDDGVVMNDETETIFKNVDELLGIENLKEIGTYEEEILHIRNDDEMTDYEICHDYREYYGEIVDEEPPEE